MDITKDVRVYETQALTVGSPYSLPNLHLVKKKNPSISIGRATQFVLWDEETKTAAGIPSACQYNTDDKHIKPSRFSGIGFGLDVKCNQKRIQKSPGPGDYNTVPAKSNSVTKKTFNFQLQNGGIEPQITGQEMKEKLIASTILKHGSPSKVKVNYLNEVAGSVLKQKRNSIDTEQNAKASFIRINKLAVRNSNFVQNQTDISQKSIIQAPVALQKHDKSIFSHNGSMATSLTNLTKSKFETKDTMVTNTLDSKEMIQFQQYRDNKINKRNLKIQVNNQNNSYRSRGLPNLFNDEKQSPRMNQLQAFKREGTFERFGSEGNVSNLHKDLVYKSSQEEF